MLLDGSAVFIDVSGKLKVHVDVLSLEFIRLCSAEVSRGVDGAHVVLETLVLFHEIWRKERVERERENVVVAP